MIPNHQCCIITLNDSVPGFTLLCGQIAMIAQRPLFSVVLRGSAPAAAAAADAGLKDFSVVARWQLEMGDSIYSLLVADCAAALCAARR